MIGNIPTQGGMIAALRERGWEVYGNGGGNLWSAVATKPDGTQIVVRGATTYAAAIRYLYNAIVGDSAPQGGM